MSLAIQVEKTVLGPLVHMIRCSVQPLSLHDSWYAAQIAVNSVKKMVFLYYVLHIVRMKSIFNDQKQHCSHLPYACVIIRDI